MFFLVLSFTVFSLGSVVFFSIFRFSQTFPRAKFLLLENCHEKGSGVLLMRKDSHTAFLEIVESYSRLFLFDFYNLHMFL